MPRLNIQIIRFVDGTFPGWIEFTITDAYGVMHHFIEKMPVISTQVLGPGSDYPLADSIECQVISKAVDHLGRPVVEVNTSNPWGIISTAEQSSFVVLQSALS